MLCYSRHSIATILILDLQQISLVYLPRFMGISAYLRHCINSLDWIIPTYFNICFHAVTDIPDDPQRGLFGVEMAASRRRRKNMRSRMVSNFRVLVSFVSFCRVRVVTVTGGPTTGNSCLALRAACRSSSYEIGTYLS